MPALLRLQQQREGQIAADIDPLDRVHLHRNIQGHGGFAHGFRQSVQRQTGKVNEIICHILPRQCQQGQPVFHGWALIVTLPKLSIASQALCDFRAARDRHAWRCRAGRGAERAPSRGADRRIRIGVSRRAERRTRQRSDLRRRDGIARHLHVARSRDGGRSTPTTC